MVRVAQVGEDVILGSERFVRERLFGFGDRIRSSPAVVRPVGKFAYSSRGWRGAGSAA